MQRSRNFLLTNAGSPFPAEVGDVRTNCPAAGSQRGIAGNPVHARWRLGAWKCAHTHDRLVRELAVGSGAAVVFVEFDRSPEARYLVAIEQGYATARWIMRRCP
jgi:acetyl esterase